jgi:hypothetical protein
MRVAPSTETANQVSAGKVTALPNTTHALVAQLDRAPDFESGGRGFESLRARQKSKVRSGHMGWSVPDTWVTVIPETWVTLLLRKGSREAPAYRPKRVRSAISKTVDGHRDLSSSTLDQLATPEAARAETRCLV